MTADAARARFGLLEQSECADREMRWRYRVYAARVRDGKMTAAERDREIGLMRAIRDTLRLFAAHEDAIRALLRAALERQRMVEEAAELGEHPAAIALQEAFPGAEIVGVADLQPPDEPGTDHMTTDHPTHSSEDTP